MIWFVVCFVLMNWRVKERGLWIILKRVLFVNRGLVCGVMWLLMTFVVSGLDRWLKIGCFLWGGWFIWVWCWIVIVWICWWCCFIFWCIVYFCSVFLWCFMCLFCGGLLGCCCGCFGVFCCGCWLVDIDCRCGCFVLLCWIVLCGSWRRCCGIVVFIFWLCWFWWCCWG